MASSFCRNIGKKFQVKILKYIYKFGCHVTLNSSEILVSYTSDDTPSIKNIFNTATLSLLRKHSITIVIFKRDTMHIIGFLYQLCDFLSGITQPISDDFRLIHYFPLFNFFTTLLSSVRYGFTFYVKQGMWKPMISLR